MWALRWVGAVLWAGDGVTGSYSGPEVRSREAWSMAWSASVALGLIVGGAHNFRGLLDKVRELEVATHEQRN
jgi:hypothetical protein